MAIYDLFIDQVHDAYRRLTHDQLILFLKVRSLPITGTDDELASRLAQFDIGTFHFPSSPNGIGTAPLSPPEVLKQRPRQALAPDLPVEILAEIMDHVGDWELAKAVGVPTSLPEPPSWTRASTSDHAILTGYLPLIRASDPSAHPPTKIGANLAVRFGYVNVLEYLLTQHRSIFLSLYKHDCLPIIASLHGRTAVLSWWKHAREQYPDILSLPKPCSVADAIDGASRNGQVAALDWWLYSEIPLGYTEVALETASAKNQLAVLAWWKQHSVGEPHRLPLKIGRVMDMASTAGHVDVLEWWARSQLEFKYDKQALYHASCHGKVDVLQWWLGSGLQLIFDPDALTGATRHNRPEVLEWWDKSGLPIQYRMCDIEEALEDAIGGGEAAREWWKRKGVDFNANDKEWMKLQNLN
ncbi:hypothetical protein AcW1_003520 [Taiwanofungus camphoratus]|nr:hypothetical protein AcV5_002015 [Antrodia cinnamomea]KAI0941706.1 hypothetical protein AcW1_003520 [Antrodia cinnamomea]KAI0960793.1 hypothetical protein AcV7_000081 [Antrodia cinnamomea]